MSPGLQTGKQLNEITEKFRACDNTKIRRYMTLKKYINMLKDKSIHFHYVNDFEDKFEGTMPESFYSGWLEKHRKFHQDFNKKDSKWNKAYVSCWNKSDNESYALWKIYCGCRGICIETTVGNLKKAINNPYVEVYKVEYKSFNEEGLETIDLPFYCKKTNKTYNESRKLKEVYKSPPYEYENEVRAIYLEVCKNEYGKDFNVDLSKMIDSVIIGPYVDNNLENKIKEITKKYIPNKNVEFKKSEILLNNS